MCECSTPNQPSLVFFHKPFESGAVMCRVVGLNGILNWTHQSYLQLHCVSRAPAFPFSAWQYPSFLFISLLSGWRKWITGLSRRGTGAITEVLEKRNFDMWGLLTLYFPQTPGVCCGTSCCKNLAAKANRPAGVISSARLCPLCLHLFSFFTSTFCFYLLPLDLLSHCHLPCVVSIYITNFGLQVHT